MSKNSGEVKALTIAVDAVAIELKLMTNDLKAIFISGLCLQIFNHLILKLNDLRTFDAD